MNQLAWNTNQDLLVGNTLLCPPAEQRVQAMEVAKVEHLLIFGLLCGMAFYLAKTIFAFKSGGLSLTRSLDAHEDDLQQIDENGELDLEDENHVD